MTVMPQFKTGDTYLLACTYKVSGSAVDISTYTIRAQMRTTGGRLVTDTTVTIDPDQVSNIGQFVIAASPADTSEWPTGDHEMDIEVSIAGTVKSTETFTQPVARDITR